MARFFKLIRHDQDEDRKPAATSRVAPWLLAAVLLLAFGLRAAGAYHGLPRCLPHMDTLHQIAQIRHYMTGQLAPQGGNQVTALGYSQPHIYLTAAVAKAYRLGRGLLGMPNPPYPGDLTNANKASFADLVLIARLVNAVLGTLAVWLVFLIGRRLLGPAGGLLAAALSAMDIMLINQTHYAMPETAQLVLVLASFLFSVRLMQCGGRANLLWAMFLAGCAAGTKYYGGFIAGAVPLAWFFSRQRPSPWLFLYFAPLLLMGFVAMQPFIWVDLQGWLQAEWSWRLALGHILWGHAKGNPQEMLTGWINGFSHITANLTFWYAISTLTLFILGPLLLLIRRRREDWLLFLVLLAGWALMVVLRANYWRERDIVFLLPFMSLAGAALLAWLWQKGRPWRGPGVILCAGVLALLAPELANSVDEGVCFTIKDTRLMAGDWLRPRSRGQGKIVAQTWLAETPCCQYLDYPNNPGYFQYQEKHSLAENRQEMPGARYLVQADFLPRRLVKPIAGLTPLKEFAVRWMTWTHPHIFIYRLDGMDASCPLVLPAILPSRADNPACLNTPWDFSGSYDFFLPARAKQRATSFLSKPGLGRIVLVLPGDGQAVVTVGKQRQRTIKAQGDHAMVWLTDPGRDLLPRSINRFRLDLANPELRPALLRLFPDPREASPLLLAQGQPRSLADMAEPAYPPAKPEHLLLKAIALARINKSQAAKDLLNRLETGHPGFLKAYAKLAQSQEPQAQWMKRFRSLARISRQTLEAQRVTQQAEGSSNQPTWRIQDLGAAGQTALCPPAGLDHDQHLKIWLKPNFMNSPLRLVFRLKLLEPHTGPVAELDVVRHQHGRLVDIRGKRVVTGHEFSRAGAYQEFAVEIANNRAPLRLEARVLIKAGARLALDQVTVEPAYRASLKRRWAWAQEALDLKELASQ